MGKIRSLDEMTVNQIAAGEVVEDPASVIKELVENAIDAGADEVVIEVKGGGRQLIRVSDNGSGMSRDDARLSLERHATSKICVVDDILAVATMGFRGEAIPSIASISKFLILTSEGTEEGTMIIVDGGTFVSQAPAARSRGTTVEVKELFFNVPARKKFQRSPTHDSNAILKVVTTLSLANPNVRFELIDNQAQLLATAAPSDEGLLGQLSDRIFDLLGHDFLEALSPIATEVGGVTLTGFVGNSMISRPNRSGQYLFINRRAVVVPTIAYAVREGYGSALPSNRHPIFVLHLSIPGDTVDVNVHPQKREVRLRRQHELKQMIIAAVEEALNVAVALPPPAFEPQQSEERTFAGINWIEEEPVAPLSRVEEAPSLPVAPPAKPQQPQLIPDEQLPPILGTIPGYIIATPIGSGGGIWLIDQRSAHCRVVYEQLQAAVPGNVAQQALLMPYTFDLSTHEAAVLRRHLDTLNGSGIQIREFGSQTFAVDALPQVFGSIDVEQFLSDLIQGLQEDDDDSSSSYVRAVHKQIAIDASRSALSSREKISLPQAQVLLRSLFSCKSPYQCPLGRVTVAKLSQQQLAKHF